MAHPSRSNTGIVGSNPVRGMYFFFECVVSSCEAISPVQGILRKYLNRYMESKFIHKPKALIRESVEIYEGVTKSFLTGRMERELKCYNSLPLSAVVSLFYESV
jgi:reverse gyrase